MTLNWGLIGAGDIARRRVAPALRDLASGTLLAVCRGRPSLAESFAKEFAAPRWYATAEELIADPDVDAVYLATPVNMHAQHAIAAAEAGKHVLCEKPMAMTVRECDAMIAACRASGVKLGVAYYRHFYPAVARARDLIASGAIGDVVMAQANAFEYFDPTADHPRHWIVTAAAGGGPMFDFGCHRIEVLLDLLGPVTDVRSMLGNVAFVRETEDTAIAILRHDRGCYATVSVTHASAESRDTLDVFGTLGSIHVSHLNRGEMRVVISGESSSETLPPHANLHLPLIDDFARAVSLDREPVVNGDIGRAVAVVEEQIYAGWNAP